MNKHIPNSIPNHQVITFLQRDKTVIQQGQVSLRRLTTQSAATLRATLVQAAEEYADHHGLSLVSTRDGRFYVNGEELVVRMTSSPLTQYG